MTTRTLNQPWKRVLVYGLGASGTAATRFLHRRGVAVVGVDSRQLDQLELGDLASAPDVELMLGTEPATAPPGVDAIVVSPGVPLDRALLVEARRRGLPVVAEVELAFAHLEGAVVGITGSNGKSTTTAMTGALLEASGLEAEVCGNIGVPLISVVEGAPGRIFVVELSSFQLEAVALFRPKAAALLNLSPDHLDRHGDLAGYLAAKARLFACQGPEDLAVLNADDPLVAEVGTRARKRFFSRHRKVADGCYLDGDEVIEVDPGAGARTLFRRSDVGVAGEHNLENAMAAALLARAVGARPESFSAALARFEGLPHRMETVALLDGIRWINDSKGTNVAAVLKSLESMEDGKVHLILGGRGKDESFEPLADPVARKAAHVYLVGEAAEEIGEVLAGRATLEHAGTVDRAVASAARRAESGEAVLLSPACTSFDQYGNFGLRGEHFRELVTSLGTEPGQTEGEGENVGG